MPRSKRLKTIDAELLLDIEAAVASGASNNPQIAKLLGWSCDCFKNYRYGKGGNFKYAQHSDAIEAAIKRGFNRRTKTLLSQSEDAIAELLRHDEYQEKHIEKRQVPRRRRTAEGWEDYTEEIVSQKIVTRRRIPNAVIAMFVAVNASQSNEGNRNIGWKSINNIVERTVSDKGEIMRRIDEMAQDETQ